MAGENAQLLSFTDRTYTSFRVTIGAAVAKGDIVIKQNQVGFYLDSYTAAEIAAGIATKQMALIIEANRAQFPKVVGVAFTSGDDLFFDDVNLELTKNNAFRPVGVCEVDALSGATTCIFRFHQEAAGTY